MSIQEKLYHVPLNSGDIAYVRPLSPYVRMTLFRQCEELFPDPDPKPFEKPLANAFDATLTEAAENNPAYKAALLKARTLQLNKLYELIIDSGVVVDTHEGKAVTLRRYQARLDALRRVMTLPDDAWLATVKYALITNKGDIRRIADATNEALTPEDIAAGVAAFQRDLQWRNPDEHPDQAPAPSAVP